MLSSILYLLFISFSHGEMEPKHFMSEINEETTLYYSDKTCTYDDNDKIDVKFDVINATDGDVAAFFQFPQFCQATYYNVVLQIFEDLSNDTCIGDYSNPKVHSKKKTYPCINESCGSGESKEYGKVDFKYVFSGCYKVQITPVVNTNSQAPLHSVVKYIQTNFLKVKISQEVLTYDRKYNYKTRKCEVTISPTFTPEKMIIILAVGLYDPTMQSCNNVGIEHSSCVMGNGISVCHPETNSSKCKNISKNILCTFYNVAPGNYCLTVFFSDDRCIGGTVWDSNSSCIRSFGIVAEEEGPDVVNVNPESNTATSLVIIVAVILLFFAGLFVWLCKRKSFWVPIREEPPNEIIPMIPKKKVLLLYPRDCECFMTVMKTFGELLEKTSSIEVFDCYNNEEVMNGPLDWLLSKLSNSQFCTIIVTSHCAYLHEEAIRSLHMDTIQSLYKEPTFLDKIFIYGLKSVMEDISPDAYCRNYLIGFRGFSDDTCTLSLPTSLRRYIIPNHFQKLLSDMNVNYHPENCNLQYTVEYVTLLSSIRSLKEYKSTNPCYLEKLLI